MSEVDGGWVALFSGGKESSWALHWALESGRDVRRLAIVHPPEQSQMYYAPAKTVTRLAARSIGIPTVDVALPITDIEPPDIGGDLGRPLEGRGDGEMETLESALLRLDSEFDGGLDGVVAGTVESEFQADRLRSMCDRVGCAFFAPLWQADPCDLLDAMLEAGLEIVFVEVAAPGFDESWLGRRLDRDALTDLRELHRERGIHILGEGGEYETVVTDGPHMSRPVAIEFESEWYGRWGRVRITEARLDSSD
ncbi:diphthine--ammonia ligase [Natrinema sp. 1APR25-10V2]|uniref:diphthine--ammonia ligase n=1 Tax=Natrinema sp. 1APR25-10V2 TaxID=2951081 RepID=UPI0028762EF0|nr:diphthine--ammonia ligase [Natrinema sp. 1APR25-10V2]MDS0477160.1 diphthine--ammonia ligase [Natrinema sp. 1APR25-10V2]